MDKIMKRLSETKRPSFWHSSSSTVGRHCRSLECRRQRGQVTWVPNPEQEVSLPCDIFSPSSIICGIFLSQYEIFLWLYSVLIKKKMLLLENQNFLLLAQRKGETLGLNEDTQVDPRASVGTVHASWHNLPFMLGKQSSFLSHMTFSF